MAMVAYKEKRVFPAKPFQLSPGAVNMFMRKLSWMSCSWVKAARRGQRCPVKVDDVRYLLISVKANGKLPIAWTRDRAPSGSCRTSCGTNWASKTSPSASSSRGMQQDQLSAEGKTIWGWRVL